MPELPETETIARDLDAEVRGGLIVEVGVVKADVLREVSARNLRSALTGKRIGRIWRRAKLVVLDVGEMHLVVQPRFTGGLLIDNGALDSSELAYVAVTFVLDDGRKLHYRDVRRLGTVALMSGERFREYSSALGVEPLDPLLSPVEFSGLLRSSRQAIKIALMDQKRVAGVGNIYANESLWRAGIDPSREARSVSDDEYERLFHAVRDVLSASIEARGTSFRDYRDARGERGSFVEQLQSYGRGGLPCSRCGRKLVETHAVDGRTTVFCASCQH